MKNLLSRAGLIVLIFMIVISLLHAEQEVKLCTNNYDNNHNTNVICRNNDYTWRSSLWCLGSGQNGIYGVQCSGCSNGGVFTLCDACGCGD